MAQTSVRNHIALYKLFNAWLAFPLIPKTIIAKNNKLADKQGKTSSKSSEAKKKVKNTDICIKFSFFLPYFAGSRLYIQYSFWLNFCERGFI